MPTVNPLADIDQLEVPKSGYPLKSRHVAATVAGLPTDVSVLHFTDKIMVTISQGGRLGMWLQVPLMPTSPQQAQLLAPLNTLANPGEEDDSLLPLTYLTPTPLLGASSSAARQTTGQLLAAQIASSVALRDPEEGRSVLVGLGLEKESLDREGFVDLVEAVSGCL